MKLSALNEAFEKKYNLDSLNEDTVFQQEIKDNKTGDVISITGDSQVDLQNKARKFKSAHGGINRYTDLSAQKQKNNLAQVNNNITADVEESLDEEK